MKILKTMLLIFAVITCGFFASCTNEGNGGSNNTNPAYQLTTPTNFRITEYEDGHVLFFDGDINAKEFRVTFFKDGSFYERYTLKQTDLLLGVYLENFESGTYIVKAIAYANETTTDINSLESDGYEFTIEKKNDENPDIQTNYVVKFNSNGGSNVTSQTIVSGQCASLPSEPSKTGYEFVEWQLNGKAFDFTTPITSNITLDAIWKVSTNIEIPDTGLTGLSSYYKNAENKTGTTLKTSLRSIINSGFKTVSYGDLRYKLSFTDVDPKNSDNIILFYGHVSVKGAWNSSIWNREHVWPKSLGWFEENGAGCDIHHIRPENPTVNSTRNNNKMGEVTNGKTCKYSDGTLAGYYGGGYFEPNDCSKGDVARIFFYMLIMYSQTDSSYPITRTAQSMELMLEWHLLDPVDDLERVRNERGYQYQGNRNPFIDYPDFAELIWG